jgi:hypothetical protein
LRLSSGPRGNLCTKCDGSYKGLSFGPRRRQGRSAASRSPLELTALVARKQPHRYGRIAARWLCLYLEEHEKATLEDVAVLVSNLRSVATPKDHGSALAILRTVARRG